MAAKAAPAAAKAPKPPVFAESGNRWLVENQKGKQDLVINGEIAHAIRVYNCEDCVLTVKGKVNAISLNSSKKVALIFDNVISAVEIANSQRVQVQVNGSVPSIMVDKTTGCTLYLQSPESRKAEIVSSVSTEIKVVVPGKTADSDPIEQPIPQQFLTTMGADGKLATVPGAQFGF